MTTKVQNPVKKGAVVACQIRHSSTYAIGSGRGTEATYTWRLAIVDEATRDGTAKRIKFSPDSRPMFPTYAAATVHTIHDHQEAARRVMDARPGAEFPTADELKAAILSAA